MGSFLAKQLKNTLGTADVKCFRRAICRHTEGEVGRSESHTPVHWILRLFVTVVAAKIQSHRLTRIVSLIPTG